MKSISISENMDKLSRENKILYESYSPFIVNYVCSFVEENMYHILTEYCPVVIII